MFKIVKFTFILLFHVGLSGCAIPVAPFYDEPLPKEQLTQLKAGASQDEVIHLLGEPNATRLNGKFWYYGATRPLVYLAGPNGGGPILDYNWTEVAFDDELRLQHADHYESKSGCARSGNCLLWGDWDPVRLVLVEFPSQEAMDSFYGSDGYREAKAIRQSCSTTRAVSVEGVG